MYTLCLYCIKRGLEVRRLGGSNKVFYAYKIYICIYLYPIAKGDLTKTSRLKLFDRRIITIRAYAPNIVILKLRSQILSQNLFMTIYDEIDLRGNSSPIMFF